MRLWETVRVALRALRRNLLRSFLTALGIIIGVAAVIAMVAIGEGARARVEQAFASMGTNVLIISSGTKTAGGAKAGAGSMPTLTWEDMKAIKNEVAGVRYVAPRLHATGHAFAFLDLRTLNGRDPISIRLPKYDVNAVTDVSRVYGGLIYIDRMARATRAG